MFFGVRHTAQASSPAALVNVHAVQPQRVGATCQTVSAPDQPRNVLREACPTCTCSTYLGRRAGGTAKQCALKSQFHLPPPERKHQPQTPTRLLASDKASSTQETRAGTYCSVSTVRQTVPTVVTNTPYIQLLVGHNLASGGHTTYQNPHKVWRWSTARKRTPKLCSVAEGGLRCIHSLESTRAHGDPSLRQASGMVQSTVKSASSLPPSSPACMICALPGYKVIQTTQ